MKEIWDNVEKRRLVSNAIGYVIVALVYSIGPPVEGVFGDILRAYLWFFPIYVVGQIIWTHGRRDRGSGK